MTRDKVIAALRKRQGQKSLREFAKELQVSPTHLGDIFVGRRSPGPAILRVLGLSIKRTVSIEYVKEK